MLPSDLLFLSIALACLIPTRWAWPIGIKHYQQRNFNTLMSIYNLTVYPNQLPILAQGAAAVPNGLFNQDIVGRVDPVGNFSGFDDSVEYFFALAPVPQTNSASEAITRVQLTEFSSACPTVAASVVYLFTSVVNPGSPDNGKPLPPLKQVSEKFKSSRRWLHHTNQLSCPSRSPFGSSMTAELFLNMTLGSRTSTGGSKPVQASRYPIPSCKKER